MKRKKFMALLLTTVMCVGLLAGCGDSGKETGDSQSSSGGDSLAGADEKEGSEDSSEEGGDASEGEGTYWTDEYGNNIYTDPSGQEYYVDKDGNKYKRFDNVELSLLYNWNGGRKLADDQTNTEFAEIMRQRLGITVVVEDVYINEAEKLNMVFASGDYPDIIDCAYWGGSAEGTLVIRDAAEDGLLLDVAPYLDDYPNVKKGFEIGVITSAYWQNEIDIYDGALYYIPCDIAGNPQEYTVDKYTLAVRGDVAETLNVDLSTITTPEALYDFMKQADEYGFKDINGNDTITFGTKHNGNYYYYLHNMFTDKYWTQFRLDENGNVTHEYLTQDWMDYQMYIWKLVHDGFMDVECFTQSEDLANEKIGNGSVLFVAAKYDGITNATIKSGLYSAHPEMQYATIGPLHYKTGEEVRDLQELGKYGTPVYIFPETCANIEAALTWLEYFDSPEGTAFASYGYGPEGEKYYFDEEGRLILTEEYKEWFNSNNSDERAERRRILGYSSFMDHVTENTKAWGWDVDSQIADVEPNVWKWQNETMSIEFPDKEKNPLSLIAGLFPDYGTKVVIAMDDSKMQQETSRAYFAKTEEEARAIIADYQKKLSEADGVQEFLEFLTNAYNENPDAFYF